MDLMTHGPAQPQEQSEIRITRRAHGEPTIRRIGPKTAILGYHKSELLRVPVFCSVQICHLDGCERNPFDFSLHTARQRLKEQNQHHS